MSEVQNKNLIPAFIKAQATFQNAKKDSENPAFKSKYADLASVVDAIRKPLGENGLAFFQFLTSTDAGICVTTRLVHTSGEFIETAIEMAIAAKTAHALGTAATYLKRYAISALLGVAAAEDDDDGNSARGKATPRHEEVFTPRAPPPPPPDPKVVVESFLAIGVSTEQLAAKLGHPPTTLTAAERTMLQAFYRESVAASKVPPVPLPEMSQDEKDRQEVMRQADVALAAQAPGTTNELAKPTWAELRPLIEAAKTKAELLKIVPRIKELDGADRVNAHEAYTLRTRSVK